MGFCGIVRDCEGLFIYIVLILWDCVSKYGKLKLVFFAYWECT